MKPKDVPAGFVEIAVEVFEDQAHEHCGEEEGCPGNTRPYHEALVRESLAEILPLHEKQLQAELERLRGDLERTDRLLAPTLAALAAAERRIERAQAIKRSPGIRSMSEFVNGQDDGWDQALAAVNAALAVPETPGDAETEDRS